MPAPNSLIDASPHALMSMFPAVSKAQLELFKRLLGETNGSGRAEALAQSMLSHAFSADEPRDPSRRRGGAMWANGNEVEVMHADGEEAARRQEVMEAYEKLGRQKLRQESLDRVELAMAKWDGVELSAHGQRVMTLQFAGLKRAISVLLSTGEANEIRSYQLHAILSDVDEWLRSLDLDDTTLQREESTTEDAWMAEEVVKAASTEYAADQPGLASRATSPHVPDPHKSPLQLRSGDSHESPSQLRSGDSHESPSQLGSGPSGADALLGEHERRLGARRHHTLTP